MRYLTIAEVLELHRRLIVQSGGASGLRDRAALESSIAQPLQSFGDKELYPSVEEKAAALGYFLISNHPFVDGNKRIGHAAMEVTLVLNGQELSAAVGEQEQTVLLVASGRMTREEFTAWVLRHLIRRAPAT